MAALGACRERVASNERFTLDPSPPVLEAREGAPPDDVPGPRGVTVRLDPIARVAQAADGVPNVAPDGRSVAIEASTDAGWAVRVGDPPPPGGFTARIEARSLEPRRRGQLLRTVDGPWVLGRGATDDGFLLERPREDGGRDLVLAGWQAGMRTIAEDGWCNAFAVASPDGAFAWSRRMPEGGPWQIVVQRGDTRRELEVPAGTSWLLPTFAGDGTGMFALCLAGNALKAAWLPFGPDGLPDARATVAPRHGAVLSLRGTLSSAVRSTMPAGGTAASPPGRGDLTVWTPDAGTMVNWLPGGRPEPLGRGSAAGVMIDDDNALVTDGRRLLRHRLGVPGIVDGAIADGAWVVRPTTRSPASFVAFRPLGGQVEFATLTLEAEAR
ncbi:MAG: hypothetical protein ACKOGJ_09115 [Phycisphaerales bacterium]